MSVSMELVDYFEARSILNRYGINTVEAKYVTSAAAAARFSNGSRIALKAISGKALHKSKSGLVALGLSTKDEISDAYSRLSKAATSFRPYKILAQKMAPNGMEIIIGGKCDDQFGKLVLLGLGGIYVEAFRDFALRLCPITMYDAESMIDQLRSSRVMAPDDSARKMLADLLVKTSCMFMGANISELDLNPVILHDGTYSAVDLRMMR